MIEQWYRTARRLLGGVGKQIRSIRRQDLRPVKIIVMLGLIAYLIHRIDSRQVIDLVQRANWRLLIPVFAVSVLVNLLYSTGWKVIANGLALDLSLAEAFELYHIGLFFNNFLPTVVGGDLARIYFLTKQSRQRRDAVLSVVISRLLSLYALLWVATGMLILIGWPGPQRLNPTLRYSLWVVPFLPLAIFWALEKWSPAFAKRLSADLGLQSRLFDSLVSFRSRGHLLGIAFACFLAAYLLVVMDHFLLAMSLHLEVSVESILVFVPLATLVTVLPVSVNGLGLREGAFAFLFSMSGLSISQSVIYSLAGQLILFIISLLGGVFYLIRTRSHGEVALPSID